MLETFHKLTLEGKSTTYDYYSTLEKLSNNVGQLETKVRMSYTIHSYELTGLLQDRYKDFLRIICQWRHLKMLLHAGRANDGIRNIEQTVQGELALMCPACPHPNINLPPEWKDPDHPNPYVFFVMALYMLLTLF